MTEQQHPITVPPELLRRLREEAPRCRDGGAAREEWIATQAARWGADQELEACLEEIRDGAGRAYIDESKLRVRLADDIWTARRPKPPSLKEQALTALERWAEDEHGPGAVFHNGLEVGLIRRALEALDD